MEQVQQLQQILKKVSRLAMYSCALADSPTGWNAMAVGQLQTVETYDEKGIVLTLIESGRSYFPQLCREVVFNNQLQFKFEKNQIAFYRHRATQQFEWLFDLEYFAEQGYFSHGVNYQCGSDCYSLTITPSAEQLVMRWRIIGTAKNEYIEYIYY